MVFLSMVGDGQSLLSFSFATVTEVRIRYQEVTEGCASATVP